MRNTTKGVLSAVLLHMAEHHHMDVDNSDAKSGFAAVNIDKACARVCTLSKLQNYSHPIPRKCEQYIAHFASTCGKVPLNLKVTVQGMQGVCEAVLNSKTLPHTSRKQSRMRATPKELWYIQARNDLTLVKCGKVQWGEGDFQLPQSHRGLVTVRDWNCPSGERWCIYGSVAGVVIQK